MTDSQFTEIAKHYDDLMAGVPYHYWVEYVEDILKIHHYEPQSILDAACGTGNVTEILAELGYKVKGVDISPGMIEIASSKTGEFCAVPYLVQDMAEMDLGESFDLVISLFDSLNYITDPARVQMALERVYEHLNPGGFFIFDINTEYALSHGFFNQSNIGSRNYPKYIWSSSYDRGSRICTVNMVFEVLEGTDRRQFTEVHLQRAHGVEELQSMLYRVGLSTLDIYHAYTFKKPHRRSDRVFFVAQKPL